MAACNSNENPARHSGRKSFDASAHTAGGKDATPLPSGGVPSVVFTDGSTTSRGREAGDVCAAEAFEAEGRKLDILILMDGSGSMNDEVDGGKKWDLLVAALRAFLNDPESAGIGVGLTYFGFPAGFDAGDLVVSCDVADYTRPAVAIDDLPENATRIVSSLSSYMPVGGTPTRPALIGAATYATTWLEQHPTHRVIVVLATDGEPNDCDSTVDAVSTVAADAAGTTPGIPTYVIGVGESLTSLNLVATAGGTGQAYLVDTTEDTKARFIAAMKAIRGRAALPCEYAVPAPDGGETDPARVNVAFTEGDGDGGTRTILLQVPEKSGCDSSHGGWYYDDPSTPKNIELCDASCTRAKADFGGRIDVLVGCRTQTTRTR